MPENEAQAGHNQPPVDYDVLTERLRLDHVSLIERRNELVNALDRVPETFEDDDTANKAADFIKQCSAHTKNCNGRRVEEKEPYLEGGRRVDGFFKKLSDPVEEVKKAVNARLTAYQRRKVDEERRRRQEEERKAREAAEAARKEAEERAAALEKEEELQGALDAEEEAARAAADAEAARKAAEAKAAEYSRSRSDAGSVSSLRTDWRHRNLDRSKLDLEKLREHLPQAALDQAVRAFIKAGGRELDGVEIYEHHESVVR